MVAWSLTVVSYQSVFMICGHYDLMSSNQFIRWEARLKLKGQMEFKKERSSCLKLVDQQLKVHRTGEQFSVRIPFSG